MTTEGTATTVAEQEASSPEGYSFVIEDTIKEYIIDLILAISSKSKYLDLRHNLIRWQILVR